MEPVGRGEAGAELTSKRRELEGVRRKLAGLIDAIADGLRAAGLQGKLDELESRKATLEADIAAGEVPPPPRLHPNLSETYRAQVTRLRAALNSGEGDPEVLEAARALIERVEVHAPAEGGREPRIELFGHLAAMLRAAGAFGTGNAKSPPALADGLCLFLGSVKVDAGTRIGLCRIVLRSRERR